MFHQTEKNVHILAANNKDGTVAIVQERKIPIVTIKSIAMSNLRDDWFVSFICTAASLQSYSSVDRIGSEPWPNRGGGSINQLCLQDRICYTSNATVSCKHQLADRSNVGPPLFISHLSVSSNRLSTWLFFSESSTQRRKRNAHKSKFRKTKQFPVTTSTRVILSTFHLANHPAVCSTLR